MVPPEGRIILLESNETRRTLEIEREAFEFKFKVQGPKPVETLNPGTLNLERPCTFALLARPSIDTGVVGFSSKFAMNHLGSRHLSGRFSRIVLSTS